MSARRLVRSITLLLLCINLPSAVRAHGNATVTRDPVAKLSKLTIDLPGRVFISYVSSLSSAESAAEVRVSGSSQEVVEAVTADCTDDYLMVATPRQPAMGEYLLVEVLLRKKSAVHKVLSDGPGDVVIGEDVLASTSLTTAGPKRMLQAQPGQVAPAGSAGFTIEEVPSTASPSKARTWMIKKSEDAVKASAVNLNVAVPGLAAFDQALREYTSSSEPYAGRVTVFGDDVPGLDQVEVVSTLTAGVQNLQVRLKVTGGSTAKNFTTLVGLAASFPVTAIVSENVQVKELQKDDAHASEALQVANSGEGTVFVSAAKSAIVTSSMSFTSHKTGGIQVEIGELWTSNLLSLLTMSSGAINYFGGAVSSQIAATPSEIGKICVQADHALKGASVTNALASEVSFTGVGATSSCKKLSVPERVPGETLSSEPAPTVAPTPAPKSSAPRTRVFGVVYCIGVAMILAAVA
ncbi:hypothetical protein Gpo141_00008424 [Globisporangium polare]